MATENGNAVVAATKQLVVSRTLSLSGSADPKSTVLLTVHSDPVTATGQADADGHWSTQISLTNLPSGDHTITAQYVTNGTPAKDSITLTTINYQPDYTQPITPSSSIQRTGQLVQLLGSILLLLVASAIIIIRRKRQLAAHIESSDPQSSTTK